MSGCRDQSTAHLTLLALMAATRRRPTLSETTRLEKRQVNAARVIAILDQRLGNQTPDWIMKLAATRLLLDPVDQETWTPLVGQR